jgi:3-oxoacyl-[acyl-carrier-protein] synthase III
MKSLSGAKMSALAVAYPRGVRTNDFFRQQYPDVVASAEKRTLAKIWAPPPDPAMRVEAFDEEMAPYLSDPFRGAVRRRVLAPGEGSRSLELAAANSALNAAQMRPEDVDLMIVSSLMPDTIATGNATYLAGELGLRGATFNLETACSSSVVGLQTASALVRAGEYRNVLVVTSCAYSRDADPADSLSWFLGDGAGAFVVTPAREDEGVLGSKVVHTAPTCGAFQHDIALGPDGRPKFRMTAGEKAGRVLRESSIVYLRTCCEGAMKAAGVSINDIDFFVFNTPTAWYAKFCARALGIDASRTIDTYPLYANIGPALMPTNLYRAAKSARLKQSDLVLLYAIGSASTASSVIMKWGNVALGPDPEEDCPN